MSAVRKFAFDTVFSPDGAVLRSDANHRSVFSADEVNEERASAFERGRMEASALAQASVASASQVLAQQAAALAQHLAAERAALREEAAALALVIARQAAGAALAAFGEERIAAAVEAAMDLLRSGPRLLVRVPTDSFNTLRPRLEDAAQKSAYPGTLVIREDPQLALGDVSIEWADGAIGLDRDALFARAEEIVASTLASTRAAEESNA